MYSQEMKLPAMVKPPPPVLSTSSPSEGPTRTKPNPLCQGQITTLFNWRWASLTIGPVVAQRCRCFVGAFHHYDASNDVLAAILSG